MRITIEATPEFYDAPINGVKVPVRIWSGRTEGGIAIEAYVLAVTPNDPADVEKMRAEGAGVMKRSRDVYDVGVDDPTAQGER